MTVWAIGKFRQVGTSEKVNKPTSAIVTDGPYKFTRNPMYLSIALAYIGIAISFNSLMAMFSLPLVILVMQFYVINREEKYLERKFGKEYLHYNARVRPWV